MHRLVQIIGRLASAYGGPGLAISAFFDSSFIPLPGGTDFALIAMIVNDPARWWYYVVMTTAGAVIGSQTLFYVARKGGAAFIERHVRTRRGQRALATLRRYELLAIIIPTMMPPPVPFKIFVLLAGATGIHAGKFAGLVTVGRIIRYTFLAMLALRYGAATKDFLQHNLGHVSIWLSIGVVLIGAGFFALRWQRRRRRRAS
jgi:membrane protein YqaA with SNARE-associated domain